MLVSALAKGSIKFHFLNNIDPERIHDQLENIELEDSLFYFVSKSGSTAETMASLAVISKILSNR